MTFYDEIYLPVEYSVINKNISHTILSPEFQRLNFISQTSSAKNKFSGSVHSRFQHSVGTAFISQIVLDRYIYIFFNFFRFRYNDFKKFCFSFDDADHENPFYYQVISNKTNGNFKKVSSLLQNMSFGINNVKSVTPDLQSILSNK